MRKIVEADPGEVNDRWCNKSKFIETSNFNDINNTTVKMFRRSSENTDWSGRPGG